MSEPEAQAQAQPVGPIRKISIAQIIVTILLLIFQLFGVVITFFMTALGAGGGYILDLQTEIGFDIALYGPTGGFVVVLILTIFMRKRRLAWLVPLVGLFQPIILTVIGISLISMR